MSHELDDDALDAALAKLGLPAEAAPLTSAASLLARAAPVAPVAPVVSSVAAGITGFKLAAMLAIAVGFGFGGGLITHFAGDIVVDRLNAARAEADGARRQASDAVARPKKVTHVKPAPVPDPVARQDDAPAAPPDAAPNNEPENPTPSAALPDRPKVMARRPAAMRVAAPAAPEVVDTPISFLQPEVSPAPPDEVVVPPEVPPASVVPPDALAVAPGTPVVPEPVDAPVEPEDERDDDLVADLDGLVTTLDPNRDTPSMPPRRDRISVAAVAAVAFPPPEAEIPPNGVLVSASVSHRTSPDGRAPFIAGIADFGLLAGKEGRRVTGALTAVGGVSWEWGSARLDLGWSGSVRGLTGMSGRPGGPGPLDVPTSPQRPGESLVLATGPRAIVALGDAGGARLHLDVAPQITGGGASIRPLPWLEVALGFDFGLKPRS